jgi:hypothetical protein
VRNFPIGEVGGLPPRPAITLVAQSISFVGERPHRRDEVCVARFGTPTVIVDERSIEATRRFDGAEARNVRSPPR